MSPKRVMDAESGHWQLSIKEGDLDRAIGEQTLTNQ